MTLLSSARGSRVATFVRRLGAMPGEEKLDGAELVMHWLAVAACVFFTAVAFWEAFGAPRSGHYATGAGYAIIGENMVHWRKFAQYAGYLARPATPEQYYCHHPYGIAVLSALAYLALGHHWFTVRAAAIFCSVLSPPLVYGFGRQAWGVIPAAIATIFFVLVPMDLAFATFSNLEEPTICFGLMFAWATARLWDTWKMRYLILSAVGALGASQGDWVGILFIGVVVIFGFFRAYVLPRRWYGPVDDRSYARWFAFSIAMAVGTLLLYLALFAKADKLGDIMGSYHLRSTGSEATVGDMLSQHRKLWLGVMFTPISFVVLGLGIPVAFVRLLRKPLEIFAIAWVMMATFQYLVFKQGADIHIFWPQYYAPAAAFAAGALTATLLEMRGDFVGWTERLRVQPAFPRFVRYATGTLLGLALGVPLVWLGRMGIPELVLSRKTAGRFDQSGQLIATDADMAEFAQWAYSNVATAGSTGQALEKYDFNFSSEYAIERPYVRVSSLTAAKPEDTQRIAVVDTRNQRVKDLEGFAKQFAVQAVGPLWRVDRAQKGPSFVARRYEEREPRPLEWMFVSGTDLVRHISKDEDPFVTWEWRDALGLPAPIPTETPVTDEELRIAHNIAVEEKDATRAAELKAKLTGRMGGSPKLDYTGGAHLLGVDVHRGPAIVVTLFWETDDTWKPQDVTYQVKCKIVAPPRLWVGPVDYFEKEMAPVPPIRPASWKPGYLYAQRFIALHRIGREVCTGGFSSGPQLVPAGPNATVFTLD